MPDFDKYTVKIRTLVSRWTKRNQRDQYESQSLLSNHSDRSLDRSDDLYAEGEQDAHHIVYWVFFIYGIAMLLPWNVFITASEYFAKRFSGTEYAENFQNYFSTYFTITNLACFGPLLWRQNKVSYFRLDVLPAVVINTLVFAIMAGTVVTSMEGAGYFWFTMGLLVLTAVTTSVFQISVFAEACRFPPQYIQSVMSGQGIAGVAVAVASLLSAFAGSASHPPDDESIGTSAFIYFTAAFLITVAALIGRIVVSRQPFYIRHLTMASPGILSSEALEINEEEGYAPFEKPSIAAVLRKSAGLIFAVGYIFWVTLAVFPSITALIKSVQRHEPTSPKATTVDGAGGRFFDDDVFVAFHFVLFNVGDWVGRTLPAIPGLCTFRPKLLVALSLSRTVFIPAFLMCNVVVSERKMTAIIDNDWVYFAIVWLFAVSNGWLGSLTMMAAPQQESITSSTEKSLVGSVMSFSLVVGLAIGGSMSFLFRGMV
ncbi:nucleoside transporter-domain-containing protein [Dichotomocladium elegans]|nr:nucleoside transporter-domain-containing protein [Dichotomocladium elegans]